MRRGQFRGPREIDFAAVQRCNRYLAGPAQYFAGPAKSASMQFNGAMARTIEPKRVREIRVELFKCGKANFAGPAKFFAGPAKYFADPAKWILPQFNAATGISRDTRNTSRAPRNRPQCSPTVQTAENGPSPDILAEGYVHRWLHLYGPISDPKAPISGPR